MEARHIRILNVAATALFAGALFAGNNYYVDAENGNDDWDGTASVAAADVETSKIGPKQTLANVMAIEGLGNGDVVYAAEGYYTNGVALVGTARYRVKVPAKVKFVASGRADRTFIVGEEAPADAADRDSYGNGTGSMRCVSLASGAQLVGFTVTGGRTPRGTSDGTSSGGAIAGTSDSYVLDCIITNNISAYRGGAIYYGPRVVRCYFAYNRALEGNGQSTQGILAYNCVCGPSPGGYHFYQGTSYNCTFIGSSSRYATTYNALILGGDGGMNNHTNCFYVTKSSDTTVDESCVKTNAAALALDENYRPVWSNVAINAGSDARYPSFPAGISSERLKDFHGAPRMIGTIDVGACEFDWRTLPATSGLEFTLEAVEGGERLRVWRNFTSDKLVKGFTYGDETVMFADVAGGVWDTNVTGQAIVNSLVPIYETNQTDWYVNPDPTKGDDANKGYHPDCPKRTLVAVMARAKSGNVVHAAKGVYNEGQTTGNTANRVTIPNGVGLVSDEGATNTVIEGYTPVYYVGETKKIGGVGSVRCVSMSGTAYIKGFTLRNGATCPEVVAAGKTSYGDNGGGVSGGTAIDCIITNCYAVRGGGASGANLIRCYVNDCNYVTGTNSLGQTGNNSGAGLNGGKVYDSYILSGSLNVSRIVNSWVVSPWQNTTGFIAYNSYISDTSASLAVTNCALGYVRSGLVLGEGSYKGTPSVDAATRRPVAGDRAIDAGNVAYYTYPAGFEHEMGKDYKGGQRIYNGQIDIGCGEHDWRGVFSGKLNGKGRAEVTAASANVTTNTLDGVVLHGGDSVEVEYTVANAAAHACTFKAVVTGEGSVTARFGDEVLVPDATGTYTFSGTAGVNRVTVSFTGEGSAVLSAFAGPHVGVRIVIR